MDDLYTAPGDAENLSIDAAAFSPTASKVFVEQSTALRPIQIEKRAAKIQ